MKIGILGGGQLGYMFLQNALQYPAEIFVLDPDSNAPCSRHAHKFTQGDFADYETVLNFGKEVDVIGIEIEHVNVEALRELKKLGKKIVPDPDVLAIIQDKGVQKEFYSKNEIPTAPFFVVDEPLKHDFSNLEFPLFQKTRKGGYDGRGVKFLKSKEDLMNAFPKPSVIEKAADLEKELAVVTVSDGRGNIKSYPPVELVFNEQYNLLDYLLMPAFISDETSKKAVSIAEKTIKVFNSPGVFAVEMFLNKSGEIWVNETACRVHNSGHSTIESAFSSQFDQMLRILMGLPLGSTEVFTTSAMVNLIGAENENGEAQIEGIDEILKIEGIYLHWYAKKETRPGRKMGHITLINNDFDLLKSNINKVNSTLKVTAKK